MNHTIILQFRVWSNCVLCMVQLCNCRCFSCQIVIKLNPLSGETCGMRLEEPWQRALPPCAARLRQWRAPVLRPRPTPDSSAAGQDDSSSASGHCQVTVAPQVVSGVSFLFSVPGFSFGAACAARSPEWRGVRPRRDRVQHLRHTGHGA